jgi:hypothetical protein
MPYYTEEERKQRFTYTFNGFGFECQHLDMSAPIYITPRNGYTPQGLALACASFGAHFMLWIHPRLGGFTGMDTLRFVISEGT